MTAATRAAALGVLAAACGLALIGCGANDSSDDLGVLRASGSSWIQGQGSLAGWPGFLSIESRAQTLAAQRLAQRKRELALLEAARLAAKQREKANALRAYLEAKRRAEAAYRAALRRAALERQRQLAKLRRLQRERAALLRKLNARLRVPPGEECADPLVREHIECRAGKLPVKGQ
jgi:hypothetical protein